MLYELFKSHQSYPHKLWWLCAMDLSFTSPSVRLIFYINLCVTSN